MSGTSLQIDYKKITLHLLIIGAAAIGYSVIFARPLPVHAQSADQESGQQTNGYEYVAEPGCSLSLLSRRSLQLFDEQSTDVSLNQAQIIYAETNIVKELGGRWLDLGEQVKIDRSLVETYAKRSQKLSPSAQQAWKPYAARANFDLSDINPTNATESASASDNKNQTNEQPQDSSQTEQQDEPAKADDSAATIQADFNWWWLLPILGTTGLLWWVLTRHEQETSKKS